MGWMYHAKCTCGKQARKAGRRTRDGVTSFAFDMPTWSRETTRVLDGVTKEHHDPAEALLNDSRARLEMMLVQQDEARQEAEYQAQSHEIPLEARMGLMVIRNFVELYNLVPDFAPAGSEERIARLLRPL